MRVLVTGGAGYIGSHTCKSLVQAGHTVYCLDNLSTGFHSLALYGEFIYGDIQDSAFVQAVLEKNKIDAVIHFAAFSCVGESVQNPYMYYRNNVGGSLSLFEAMGKAGVGRLVVSSSCAVYGLPDRLPIDENEKCLPVSPYGATKLMMERMLEDFQARYNISCVSLRYFNAAGADLEGELGECHTPETHLIPRALMAAFHEAEALAIFGVDYDTEDGSCVRDYIHVCDLAKAHILALNIEARDKVFVANLGTGLAYSVKQIVAAIEEISGKKVPNRVSARRAGDPPLLVASAEKAVRELGWKAEHSDLQTIIASALQWHIGGRSLCISKGRKA